MRGLSYAARLAPALPLALTACAGGGPLLHPAKTMGKGEVRIAAGMSGEAIASDFATALESARNEAATAQTQPTDARYAKGALVAAAVNPGIAPFVSARVGVGHEVEGGLTYTGRSARVDFRRSFSFGEDKAWAVSIGAGGSAALYGRLEGASLPGVNLSDLKGYGADLPLLIGYEATDGLYMVWLGARGGWEHDAIQQLTSEPSQGAGLGIPPVGLSADRYWIGPVLGAASGFRHVHVAVEIDASYETVSGSFGGTQATVTGVAIVPATAVWFAF